MADINKFTTKEVLNKVLLDSSGDAVAAFSHTTQEALNAVLDTANNRLNVSIAGGTISGDVTIAGDLTVQGDGSGTYSEIITGVLQISSTTLNGAPINLLSRDTAVDTNGEGVRIRFGKSDDSFLADFGYKRQEAADKGANISSTDNLRFALAGQDVSHFMFKGGNSTTGASMDIRTHETTVVANDVLGKITFSAPYESSGTDAILAGAEIKALATAEFTSSVNSTDLIFSTGASEAATEKMRITSAGLVGIGGTPSSAMLEIGDGSSGEVNALHIKGGTSGNDREVKLNLAGNFLFKRENIDFKINRMSSSYAGALRFVEGASDAQLWKFGVAGSSNDLNIQDTSSNNVLYLEQGGNVGIGTTSITSGCNLHIKDTTDTILKIESTQAGTDMGGVQIYHNSGSPAANDSLGYIAFLGNDSGASQHQYAKIEAKSSDVTGGAEYGELIFSTIGNASDGNRFIIDGNSRISLSNNDSGGTGGADSSSGNTIFGNLAGANLDSGSINNILIGHHAGKGLSGSTNDYTGNVLIGGNSGRDITQGDENVAVGYNAGRYIQQGSSNTFLGHNAGNAVVNANNNTIVGANAGDAISSGANNSILGTAALSTATTALNNVFIGRSAGEDIPAGQALDGAVAIGWEAFKGGGSTTTGADNTIAIGKEALKSLTTGVGNVAIGYQSGDAITSGGANVALGYQSLSNVLTGSGNVAIGYQALLDADNNEEQNIAIGQQSMENLNYNGSGNNIAMGLLSMNCGTVSAVITDNIAIGQYTLSAITQGSLNVAIGGNALAAATTATSNVAIGKNAMLDNTTGGYTIAIGREALANINDDGNDGSVAIGYAAGQNQVGSGTQYDFANTLVGRQSGKTITTGALNTALGFETMGGVHGGTALTGSNNVAVGHKAGRLMEAVSEKNTLVGSLSGTAITTGDRNTLVGYNSGYQFATGADNTVVGSEAFQAADGAESRNTIIGKDAGYGINDDSANDNVVIGDNALVGGSAAISKNVAIGKGSMSCGSTASQDSVFIGYGSGAGSWGGACTGNTAVGYGSMGAGAKNAGNNNTALGHSALNAITSGDENVGLGHSAGDSLTGGSYNTIIGRLADGNATANGQLAVGYGTSVSGGYGTRVGYSGSAHTYSTVIGGLSTSSDQSYQTVIGEGGMFKFVSKEYTCDHASNDDNDIASSTTPIKIPARAVIKNISAVVTQLSDLGTYTLAVFYSDDSTAPSDDSGLTNGVELIGAGASPSKSGSSGSTEDIEVPSSGGVPVKAAFYQGFDGNGKHVGTAPRYIHIVNAGTGNGDTDPGQAAKIKILVEYVGVD